MFEFFYILSDSRLSRQKHTDSFKEEIQKHTTDIHTELNEAGQSIKRQIDDAATVIKDEGKIITDTTKE